MRLALQILIICLICISFTHQAKKKRVKEKTKKQIPQLLDRPVRTLLIKYDGDKDNLISRMEFYFMIMDLAHRPDEDADMSKKPDEMPPPQAPSLSKLQMILFDHELMDADTFEKCLDRLDLKMTDIVEQGTQNKIFSHIDLNESGKLNRHELMYFLETGALYVPLESALFNRQFGLWDMDGDEELDEKELKDGILSLSSVMYLDPELDFYLLHNFMNDTFKMTQERCRALFTVLDTDNDERITKADKFGVFFMLLDIDADNRVDSEEIYRLDHLFSSDNSQILKPVQPKRADEAEPSWSPKDEL